MSNLVADLFFQHAPVGMKRKADGWNSFNAVCCTHNGQSRPDTRGRGGVIMGADGSFTYHCFNCKFKTSWKEGRLMSNRVVNLLRWLNVPDEQIRQAKFKAWQLAEMSKRDIELPRHESKYVKLEFPKKEMPEGAKPFSHWLAQDPINPNFLEVLKYLDSRGSTILSYDNYWWTPETKYGMSKRVLIPYKWNNEIVGYVGRAIGPAKNRYYGDIPHDYLFNTESIKDEHQYVFVVEGPFDAIAIDGVATLGDKISDTQCRWLNQLQKKIVVVADRENRGGALVNAALTYGWYVSFPKWFDDIKDAADASRQYGQLFTVWSILDSMTNDRFKINVWRQTDLKYDKRRT